MKLVLGCFIVLVLCAGMAEAPKMEGCNAPFLSKQLAGFCTTTVPTKVCCEILSRVFTRRSGATCAMLIAKEASLKEIGMTERMIVNMFMKCSAASIGESSGMHWSLFSLY